MSKKRIQRRGIAAGKGSPPVVMPISPTAQERVLVALRGGNYLETAAHYAGIDPKLLRRIVTEGDPLHKNTTAAKQEFREKVVLAEAEGEAFAIQTILRVGRDRQPKMLTWWLERRFPNRWGRKDRLTVVSQDAGALGGDDDVVDLSGLSDAELAQLAGLLQKAEKPDKPEGE